MTDLKKIEHKRSSYASRISDFYRLSVSSKTDVSLRGQLEARRKDIEQIYQQFYELHNELIGQIDDEAEFKVQDKIRKDIDTFYYESLSIYNSIIKGSDSSNSSSQLNVQASANLPPITIPTFHGDQKLWPTFFDLFQKLIHENSNLSDVEKFRYLLSYLQDEPLKLVSGIAITNDNYSVAYDKLINRYQNKRLLASNALNSIMSVTLKSENFKDLRALLNVFSESLAALKALNFDVDQWDFILFHILLEKLDISTRTNFEIQYSTTPIPEYKQLFQFLENKCKALESVQHLSFSKANKTENKSSHFSVNKVSNFTKGNKSSGVSLCSTVHSSNTKIKCYLCKEPHVLSRCPKFLEKSITDRNAYVKQNKLCSNCLHHSHDLNHCNSTFRCRICHKRHHTVLHNSNSPESNSASLSESHSQKLSTPTPVQTSQNTLSGNTYSSQSTVLLATAVVDICDGFGQFQPVRILIDSGSQSNFINEKCLRRLGLTRRQFSTTISGLNEMTTVSIKGITHCTIKSRNSASPVIPFDAVVIPTICSNMPSFNIENRKWPHLQGLELADKHYFRSGSVDLLIGAEVFPQILQDGRITGDMGQPTAIKTIFGWIILGRIDNSASRSELSSFFVSSEIPLEIMLPKFWEIEHIPTKPFLSSEDIKCEEIFNAGIARDSSGRFIVPLPFRNSEPDLGDTYTQAFIRFSRLESRLIKSPELYKEYCAFMRDYIDSGHMSLISPDEMEPTRTCYLPHHCVIKPESVSTKLRVVWDGSAKGPKGISLNDTLLSGPKLQKDITGLLLLFRIEPIVFIADIKQMFRQVLVTESHRKFQRILWRFSPSDPLHKWTLNTVTFGLSCSPYLAMRTLQQLADIECENFPQASKLLKTQVYIDDILGTSDSVSSALSLQNELIKLLKLGGFELRKWASNSPELLKTVPNPDHQMPLSFDKEQPHFLKVLGLQWQPYSDSFSYHCRLQDHPCTKRAILSDIGRIFDPLGFLCPILLLAKYFMQCLWTSHTDWDETPPQNIVDAWCQFKSQLPELSSFTLPRRILTDNFQICELHGFCDASSMGFGAVVYFRVEYDNKILISLVCAKSRVAPLKTLTIPKLELAAAKLLADLIKFIKETCSNRIIFNDIFAWSDSQVVLSWLNSPPCKWKPFVANRVSYIQDIMPSSSWNYVPTELNVADIASRGAYPKELLHHPSWWKGPSFLYLHRSEWNKHSSSISPEERLEIIKEEKKVVLQVAVDTHFLDILLHKHSSLSKIQRILVYCLRVPYNFRHPSKGLYDLPKSDELHKSLMCLVKHTQTSTFSDLISKIHKNELLPKPFRKLSLFLDSDGFLRAGGRLRKSQLSFSAKYPLLLPSSHRLTSLIIEQAHHQYLHPGLKTLHNLLLQQFWILSARRAIHKTVSTCLRCFRARPKTYNTPIMSDLPAYRISQLKPFSHVAIDFCGPFPVTMYRMRGAKTFKSYVCVFVCTATRAIHLEVTQELSTDSFVAAFRRFIARRGNLVACYSDNGTNFVGASNHFFDLARQTSDILSFRWHFSPPSGPHFNGLAEAGVKMVKSHLIRVVGDQRLSYEEFTTLLCQIESVLNSRPLCSQSSDPNDLIPLTPGHFLTQEPLNSVIPEPDLSHLNISHLSRWQLVQKLHNDFWKRYFREYINTLQQRLKWINPAQEVKLGDLVLIKSETASPLKWPLGRVIQLHTGDDGHTRVVTLKTLNGQLCRPVVKLCPLPTN